MSEKKTVNDDELKRVSGGNRQQVTVGTGNQSTSGTKNQSISGSTQQSGYGYGKESFAQSGIRSGIRNYLGKCEPEENETNPLQKPTCSDPTNRGKKTECADCPAGIR